MQPHFHAIVWIDHQEAKVFHVGLSGTDQIDLHPHLQIGILRAATPTGR